MSQKRHGEVSPSHVSKQDVLPFAGESEALDSVFRALSDHRRRCVCHYLVRRDDPIAVDELAELVAASMSEKSRAVLTAEEVEKTRAELLQMHLPKLSEAGIVERDSATGEVRLTESPGVTDALDAVSDVDFN